MERYVLGLEEIDRTHVGLVGGKGAHLGELMRIDGVLVPPAFCVTTVAFGRIIAGIPSLRDRLEVLARLEADDREAIGAQSAEIRRAIEGSAVPDDVLIALNSVIARLGEKTPCAIRSSATAEDLPTASFAGQQDTYLNVIGRAAILRHVSRCWASLFTDRAVTYRLRNGIDQSTVRMGVVVQEMAFPTAAGILFTADPITGNRTVSSIEASFGLGEALVSGKVDADIYKVRDGEVISRAIGAKQIASYPVPSGGTQEQTISADRQGEPALTHAQAVRLAEIGRRIETHFGCPQDIEWCLVDEEFQIVQSRPVTTLFPIPAVDDQENHVYLSVGHQQMMTDAMKPLGLSFWQMTTPRPMAEAAGRLFVDVTAALASPVHRAGLLDMVGRSDPLMMDALQTILDRGDFIRPLPSGAPEAEARGPIKMPAPLDADPTIVTELMGQTERSLAALERDIATKSGPALLDFILEDLGELRRILHDVESHRVFMTAIEATWWLNERLETWLGEKNAADTLAQSAPHNVTSEMGLALLDVADAIRPHPDVVAYLQRIADGHVRVRNAYFPDVLPPANHALPDEHPRLAEHAFPDELSPPADHVFLGEMARVPGGPEAVTAIGAWLDRYGMRGPGEIDITRPRWRERPTMLVPTILGNVRNFEPGAGARRFEQGRQEARTKEHELLERLRRLPDGETRAEETKGMVDRVRTFIGYREYPKYGMVSRYFIYKQALLEEAGRLVRAGVLRRPQDIFYLRFEELQEVVRTGRVDDLLIRVRRDAFRSYQALTPPRVLTSEGEAISGAYRREDLPVDALVGLPVSGGTVEGRARVVLDMAEADLEPGDILVTAYTDPSWTPLFVAIAGLVTEVGGAMTHGAVIAREYGLPAVVGVAHATRLIPDGQRIRVRGTDGYIELLG